MSEPAARALCTPAAGQFAERSFAEQAAREQLALPLQAAQATRSPKRREPLAPKKVVLQAVPRDVAGAQLPTKTPLALVQLETPQPGAQVLEAESRSPLEPEPPALLPEAQPLPDGSPQLEAQPLVSLPEAEPLAHA